MKLYIINCFVVFTITGVANAQSMFENFFNNKPEYINLRSIDKEIEYWSLNKKQFIDIQEQYDLELIESLSELESDLKVFKVKDYCLVEEQGNYTLFKNLQDVKLISSNYDNSYDPIEDFNYLGKSFIDITYIENKDLANLTNLDLDYSISSLDDVDVYVNSIQDTSSFIFENRLILMSYLGNVFIKNSKTEFFWEVKKTDDKDYWEVFLVNKEKEEIDISKWFLEYVYEKETQIIGTRGVYDLLTIKLNVGN